MTTSGTMAFALSGADLLLEAFDRLQIRPSEITADHVISARRSMNLVQVRWANRGTNLWKVDPTQAPTRIPLVEGVGTYSLDPGTIMLLDVWLRTFQMSGPVNLPPGLSTAAASGPILADPTGLAILAETGSEIFSEGSGGGAGNVVIVRWPAHGLFPGAWVNFLVPVSAGGIVISGLYQVASVVDQDDFTITAAANATSVVSDGGVVPAFTTTQGSPVVTVTFANHGQTPGSVFAVGVPTSVGGLALSGDYVVGSVPTGGSFTIDAGSPALSSATASENGGQMQLAGQLAGIDPIDRILTPWSRTDYAAAPDKGLIGVPSVYLFDRQAGQPTVTVWAVPDGNGPYELRAYTVRQLQDATALASQGPDVPYRFLEALCADLALHLAKKHRPEAVAFLKVDADEAWEEAAAEDRERVPMHIVPDLSAYFR